MPSSCIRYCSLCGANVEQRVPHGDTLKRAVCPSCDTIHYENPKIVAGCIPEWQGDILLCRRAIPPRKGFWTFPAGYMEMGESTADAAARETKEEALADVDVLSPFAVYTLTHVDQVYIVFRGRLRQPEFGAGEESLDVRLVPLAEIPWDHLAFPVIKETLCRYVEDRGRQAFGIHHGDIPPMANFSTA